MSESKKIWTGTWMGIAAHVEMIGGAPVPFLSGRRAQFETDVHGILGAAVVGLAADERRAMSEIGNIVANVAKELDPRDCDPDGNEPVWLPVRRMRDRLAKLEAGLVKACDEWEHASQYKGEFLAAKHGDAADIAELRELLKGSANGETSKV